MPDDLNSGKRSAGELKKELRYSTFSLPSKRKFR